MRYVKLLRLSLQKLSDSAVRRMILFSQYYVLGRLFETRRHTSHRLDLKLIHRPPISPNQLRLKRLPNLMFSLFPIPLFTKFSTPSSDGLLLSNYKDHLPIDSSTVSRTHRVKLGTNTVWLDCVDNYTHAEAWLELRTADVPAAADYLRSHGVATVDELEKIPKDMHWVMDPAGTVLLLCKPRD